MRLLRNKDYRQLIQDKDLKEIVEDNYDILLQVEQAAQSELKGYLVQRYRTEKIFTDTTVFSIEKTYYGGVLVEYTADDFSTAVTYSSSDRVLYEDGIYSAITGSTNVVPGATGSNYTWNYITPDKTLYTATLPAPEFSINTQYNTGDVVFYDNVIYTALSPSKMTSPLNVNFWSAGASYSFSGVYPDDVAKWTPGDNRNAYLVQILIDTVLYHLYARLDPRLTTQLRSIRYDGGNPMQSGGVKRWLTDVARGFITADLPQIIPTTGLITGWGKNNLYNSNTY